MFREIIENEVTVINNELEDSYKRIDLHIHTTASDGMESPECIVYKAVNERIAAIAITDHDTVDGINRALEVAKNQDIEFIQGAEFSAGFNPVMHIIGLFIDINNEFLLTELNRLNKMRMRLITKSFKLIARYGILVSPQQVLNKEKAITIVKLKKYLADNNLLNDEIESLLREILDEWKKCLPTPEKCISMIHSCGGVAILAHPKLLHRDDEELLYVIMNLKKIGLDGIEVIHPSHSLDEIVKYKEWTRKFNLLCSGGSDYHSEFDHYAYMKSCEQVVPYIFLKEMKQKIEDNTNAN